MAMEHAADALSAHINPKTIKLLQTYNYEKLETKLLTHLAIAIGKEPPPDEHDRILSWAL